MKRNRRFLAALTTTGLLVTAFATSAAAQFSVLVDASRDGGVWWFPQSEPDFDPNLPHQGKALADFLRSQGMTVTELPRPTAITCQQLSQYHLIMVVASCGFYSTAELGVYNDYLANGGRLILLGEHSCDFDTLPQSLGLDFTGALTGTVTEFIPHPITTGVAEFPFIAGGAVTGVSASATLLGFLLGMPVMGIVPFGSGEIFFLGDSNGIEGIPQPFVNNLFEFMLAGAQPVNACPVPTIGAIITQVLALNLNVGEKRSLMGKLAAAQSSLSRGNYRAVINQLDAFINQVGALERSRRLDSATASGLIAAAQAINGSI